MTVAIFFLFEREQSIRILLSVLGAYLLIDGVLDIQKLVSGKRRPQHARLEYLVTAASMLLGLISFVFPSVTILFFLILVALRFIIRGIEVIREAMRDTVHTLG